jgi:hypothetical protein
LTDPTHLIRFVLIVVLEVVIIFIHRFVLERLAREVVDRTRDDLRTTPSDRSGSRRNSSAYLLLKVLADLVVYLKLHLELCKLLLRDIILIFRRYGWGKEVEERVSGASLLYETRALGV